METYYHLEDLPKFKEIGKDAYELEKKNFEYYDAVLSADKTTENG